MQQQHCLYPWRDFKRFEKTLYVAYHKISKKYYSLIIKTHAKKQRLEKEAKGTTQEVEHEEALVGM